jgi:hypothetical protein
MWEPRCLTTLLASTASYRDRFLYYGQTMFIIRENYIFVVLGMFSNDGQSWPKHLHPHIKRPCYIPSCIKKCHGWELNKGTDDRGQSLRRSYAYDTTWHLLSQFHCQDRLMMHSTSWEVKSIIYRYVHVLPAGALTDGSGSVSVWHFKRK